MNLLKNIRITLYEKDVKELIAEYFTEKGYPTTPNDVLLNVGRETRGYGPGEYEECVFQECVVKVKGETK